MKSCQEEKIQLMHEAIKALDAIIHQQREKIAKLEQKVDLIEAYLNDEEGEEDEEDQDDCCCGELVPTSMLIHFNRRDNE